MTARPRGMTVAEILVASALLLVVMTLAIGSLAAYSRAFRGLAEQHPSAARLAAGMNELGRLLRSARALRSPDRTALSGPYSPRWGATAPLVLEVPGESLVGVAWDERSGLLKRFALGEWDPSTPYPVSLSSATTIGECRGVTLCLESIQGAEAMTLQLEDRPGCNPWRTTVLLRLRGFSPAPGALVGGPP